MKTGNGSGDTEKTTQWKEYGKSHNVLLASCRAGNVIGGGDWAKDRLMTDIMVAVSQGKKVVIRNPRATRPWQHVLESFFKKTVNWYKNYYEKNKILTDEVLNSYIADGRKKESAARSKFFRAGTGEQR